MLLDKRGVRKREKDNGEKMKVKKQVKANGE